VTILRADILRSTDLVAELDPEEAVSRLEPALMAMRAAVRQFGGIVSKEMGDGLAAVFGAPVADDNHASLACHAAIELVRRVAALGDPELQVRVGLHSGLVVMYLVTTEYSKIYEIGGAAQYLAARLETAAEPGQINASEACQKLAEGHVQFQFLGLRPLKGFADPVPVYRVLAARDLSSWQVRNMRSVSRFVGRSPEMALLRHAAEASHAGSRTVCVTGEPGMGKSRLVHEFVQELATEGWTLVEAACTPNSLGAPFAALKGLLRSILEDRLDFVDPQEGLSPILRSAIDAVLDRPAPDKQWQRLEPQVRGSAIVEASCALVKGLARRQRTVLLLEDLHWVDRASVPVVMALASLRVPDLLVLVTSRPNGVPDWLSQGAAEVLGLRALDASAGWAMLDDILGLSSTTLELKKRIIRHTANVPLFVEEVCRRLKETGVLQGQWGDLTLLEPVDDLGIPASIQGAIAARLDRLTKQERALVQVAAALGRRSKLATLRVVAALPETQLESSLAELDRTELLVRDQASLGESVNFMHEMVRQVAYESMVGPAREDVHARILSALESDHGSREETDKLCYHATRAKDWAKAFGYGRDVAQKCVQRSAFADATTYYEIAIDAVDKTPLSRERETQAIDLRTEARMAFMGLGRVAEWLDLGREAERRAIAIDDIGRTVAAMTVRAAAENFHSTPIEAIETGEQVVGLAERWGDRGWLNLALYGLGQAYVIAGRYLDGDRVLDRACAQLTEPNAVAPIGTTVQHLLLVCCMMKSVANTSLGELDAAEHFHQRAHDIARWSNRPFDRVAAAYCGGTLMLGRGDPTAAATILNEAIALARQHNIRLFIPMIACQRGMAYLEQGYFDIAKEILAEARQDAKAVGYKSTELRAAIYLALALGRTTDLPHARDLLRETIDTARQQGLGGLEAEARLCAAMITPAASDDARAEVVRNLRESMAISSRNGAKPLLLKAETLLSKVVVGTEG
jgi:class 3 adenylate cyclase/tetratricopeptide (TPR) repeat protein